MTLTVSELAALLDELEGIADLRHGEMSNLELAAWLLPRLRGESTQTDQATTVPNKGDIGAALVANEPRSPVGQFAVSVLPLLNRPCENWKGGRCGYCYTCRLAKDEALHNVVGADNG